MRALTAAEVLSVWEAARGRQALRMALECLSYAEPERSRDDWAALPFGRVCHALLRLRALMFGPAMPGVVGCPRCGEQLEFQFDGRSVPAEEAEATGPLWIESGDRTIEICLPTAGDLLEARSAAELLRRCARGAVEPDPAWIGAASACVAEADPLSETTLDLVCPSCGHAWQAVLDVVAYFRDEISHEAHRLLGEVHRLALVYGWGESEILALNPARRRAYLELASA